MTDDTGGNADASAAFEADIGALSADEATAEIARLRGDEGVRTALADAGHAQHDKVHARMHDLYRRAGGEEVAPLAGDSDEARLEIDRLKADSKFQGAYLDASHPDHEVAVRRMDELYRRAYPDDEYTGAPAPGEEYEEALRSLRFEFVDHGGGDELSQLEDYKAGRLAVSSWLSALKLHPGEARQFVEAFNGAVAETEPDPDFGARAEKTLRAVWGDDFDKKLDAAWRAVERIDGDGTLRQLCATTRLGEDVWFIQALAYTASRNGW